MNAAANPDIQPPGILWGRHRFHEIARWMLMVMPPEKHRIYLMRGKLPGDERDFCRGFTYNPPEKFLTAMAAYLRINRLVLRARNFAHRHPESAPREPFLHWWQQGIEQVGEQFFINTTPDGNYWNANNIWELVPKPANRAGVLATQLETAEQHYILCFMLALHQPYQALAVCRHLDVVLEETQHLEAKSRRLIYNLLATFQTF